MASYDDIVNLASRRSFFYPASEIYNGPAGFYSYGPYGVAMREAMKRVWREVFLAPDNHLEIDSSVTMPSDVFKASGHLGSFADPITICQKCHSTFRADQLLEEKTGEEFREAMPDDELTAGLIKHKVMCPGCKGALGPVERASLMVKAEVGVSKDKAMYLRPETCQSIFVDFSKLFKTMRMKLPQGIAQIGKSYRNEISPRQTLIRQVEFYQMETEVFFNPEDINTATHWDDVRQTKLNIQLPNQDKPILMSAEQLVKKGLVSGKLIAYYMARTQLLFSAYGFGVEKTRFRGLDDDERAFYAKEGWDFEVMTDLGWMELIANNYRTDYDLSGHSKGSGKDFAVMDDRTNKKFVPHVWEISIGFDRTFYAILENSYREDEKRKWLSLPASVAPVPMAVFPLLKNKPQLVSKAKEVLALLRGLGAQYDESGSIGKRYARMDEIGTPLCVTIDFDTLEDSTVTIRERDTMHQERVPISALQDVVQSVIKHDISLKDACSK